MSTKPFPVPGNPKFSCATPTDVTLIKLLGGSTHAGVAFTVDQMKALHKVYLFTDDFLDQQVTLAKADHDKAVVKWQEEHDEADDWRRRNFRDKPKPFDAEAIRRFYRTGSERNLYRHAQRDGLRLMAFLAHFVEQGHDPVKLVVQLACEAGFDVGEHYEWAFNEDEAQTLEPAPQPNPEASV